MKLRPARASLLIVALFSTAALAACGRGGSADIHKDDVKNAKGDAAGAGDGTTTAGTRLVPLAYHGSDGSKAFAGLFDKQLGKPCTFERLGSVGVCVPPDVYTVSAEVFYDSLKTASPALYLDPECNDRKAIALDEQAECTSYGVIRIKGSQYSSDMPGCGYGEYGSGLTVVTPLPAGKKVYAWGQGGGQCCSCAEWVPPKGAKAFVVGGGPDETSIAKLPLVTATMDDPTQQ